MSLDGFNADEKGNFDWAEPDEEVHRFANELERSVGTYLFGRRMYETMVYWETQGEDTDVTRDFAAMWRATDKVVYSRTLREASSARTRIERQFEPAAVLAMKESAAKNLAVGGPHLAAQALEAGLVDELQIFVAPALVGAGNRALPGLSARLALLEERRFGNGMVFLRYRIDR
jgi:dihydrofolate reductase